MKELKKWWNEKRTLEETFIEIGYPRTQDQLIDALSEVVWRAALKMLSKKIKQITNPPNCRCLLSVQEIIDEELEDE